MIRVATDVDADSIAAIYIRSRSQLPYAKLVHADGEIKLWIRDVLLHRGGVFVKDQGQGPIAMMALSSSQDVHWIDQLYVDPDFTGQGIGKELLAKAKEELGRPIWVYAFQQNDRARKFYEKGGFRPFSFSDGSRNEEQCPDVLYVLGEAELCPVLSSDVVMRTNPHSSSQAPSVNTRCGS